MSKRCCVSLWLVLPGLLFGIFLVIISILMSTHFSQSLVPYDDTMAPLACASQDGIIDADAFDRHFDKIRYLGWCFISLSTLGLFVVLGHCTVLYLVYLVMYLSFCMGILSMIITHISGWSNYPCIGNFPWLFIYNFGWYASRQLSQLWMIVINCSIIIHDWLFTSFDHALFMLN